MGNLTFEEPDEVRFPALGLARAAMRRGGTAPAVLNAANEVAVQAFLAGEIGFLDIAAIVGTCLDRMPLEPLDDLPILWEVDRAVRKMARSVIEISPKTILPLSAAI
jgi:1-deoxy-D-xylulose-5-phosphate reductoisomerase